MERVVQGTEWRETARSAEHEEAGKRQTLRAAKKAGHERIPAPDEATKPVTAFVTEWYIHE